MSFDYAVCPHCGCRCEDDEYCAACGKLFEEDAPTRSVSFLGLLGSGARSQVKKIKLHRVDHKEMFKEDLWDDPSWSILPGNLFHKK